MLNCDTIKLETYVNVSLLMLTMAAMLYWSRSSADPTFIEMSLEVLTTIIFPHAICMK